jgi:hypothetical protein
MKLSKFAGIALAAALIAIPAYAAQQSQSTQAPAQQAMQSQTVTGTVVSVTDTALTVNTSSNSDASQQANSAATQVKFVIDANTKIDGTPSAGAKATVEYTTDSNNRKVATHVTIQS